MWRRFLLVSFAIGVFTLLAGRVWQKGMQEVKLNVILLTVESLRADRVCKEVTPSLLQAAEKGYRFPEHRAISGWTGTNIVTLLSGLTPFVSGVHTRGQSVDPAHVLPLEQLSARGYRVSGLQGFMAMDIYRNLGLTTFDAGQDVLYWLTRRIRQQQPFFLWDHYVYTHLPYRPTKGYSVDWQALLPENDTDARKRVQQVYDKAEIFAGSVDFQRQDIRAIHALQEANIREFDRWFSRFWKFFNQSGLIHNTMLIVTADHGDEHGERGSVGHASTTRNGHLHEEIVRVPLFIWLPEKQQKHLMQPDSPASSHLDIMPTILARIGLQTKEQMMGRDLFGGEKMEPWFGMTSGGGFAEEDPKNINHFEYGVVAGGWKLLWRRYGNGEEETRLYHLNDDPNEIQNLAQSFPERAASLRALLAPAVTSVVSRPLHLADQGRKSGGNEPRWIFPERSGNYSYDDLQGRFYLEWTGDPEAEYIIEYKAGHGEDGLEGQLKVDGVRKDFGTLSRRYWETWMVAAGPVRVKVRRVDGGGWSEWLQLEAIK